MKRLILAALLTVGVSGEAVASDDEAVLLHCVDAYPNSEIIAKGPSNPINVLVSRTGDWIEIQDHERGARVSSEANIWEFKVSYKHVKHDIVSISLNWEKLTMILGRLWMGKGVLENFVCQPFKNPFTN